MPLSRVLPAALAGLAAFTLVAAGLGSAPSARADDASTVGSPEADCRATSTRWSATRTETTEPLSERFTDFADTTERNGWSGGDTTHSVDLPGKRVWIFSDTFLGPVNADGSRPKDTPFINNSFVVQRGRHLDTVHGGTASDPDGLLPPDENGWWWFGAATANRAERSLDVIAIQFAKTGDGPLDFAWQRTALARFDQRTLALEELIPLPSDSGVTWSSWVDATAARRGGNTYIYGTEDRGAEKFMHIARTAGTGLDADWEYWTGDGWSTDEADSTRVLQGVSNEYSVTPFAGGYLLVTHDTLEPLSAKIKGYFSCSPTGPFVNPIDLYSTPETGAAGSYGNPNIWTYNAHEHPDLRRGNRLLVTYNVNSFDPNVDLYADVSIYRPRFVDVTLAPER